MYRKIEDFIPAWNYEIEATLKIFNSLSDESLTHKVTGYERTLGILAWHITTAISEMGKRVGLNVYQIDQNSEPPITVKEIADAYKKVAESLSREVKDNWNDDSLLTEVDMYGEMWKNGVTLMIIIGHQAHHRAQMTVLMRILGLKVPGVCGPSKEEWEQLGMQPQK